MIGTAVHLANCGRFPAGVVLMMAAESIEDLENRLAEIMDKADEIEAKDDPSDEDIAQVEAWAGEIEALNKRIAAKKTLAAVKAGAGRRTAPDPAAKGDDGAARRQVPPTARVDARTGGFRHLGEFASCVRAAALREEGAMGRLSVLNANMGELTGEDGGILVPAEFRESIMKVVEGEESLLSRCDASTTARNAVMHPKDETTPWGTSGIRAYWEGEASSVTAANAKFQGDTLRLNKLFARVDVTDELLEDAPQLDRYLRVKAPEVMTSVINLAIINGNGVGKPLGFMQSPALVSVAIETSQPTDTVHHRNIVKMWSRMYAPCRARSVWLINQDVEPQLHLMSFRDGTTTPVPAYMPPGGVSTTPYGTLLGRPIIPVQGMETLGDLGDIALVDLSMYRALTKSGGARVDTSIHLKFDTDETVYRFIFRLGGAPWWSAPISSRDGSNTLSPFVTLATR